MFDLKGKKALVTGASGGIGVEIVKKLMTQGAVVGLADRRMESVERFEEEIGKQEFKFIADLSDEVATEKLFDEADDKMGGVDILICNAGLTKDMLVMRMKNEDWDAVLNVNLKAAFILNRSAIKRMMKRRYGRIVNMASIVGVIGNPGQANYVASKAGLIGMSKSIAGEVASRGITVNCVAPGFIRTPMTDVLSEEQKAKLNSAIPMGRMGLPGDIANAVIFLSSEEAGYITGQTIHVNGGMAMI
ncbi:3-oxoacyl-[acyl-carrier-protein] reductase [Pseudomonadota bacterium]